MARQFISKTDKPSGFPIFKPRRIEMSISSSALLVELNISVWPATKVDKDITESVNANASAVRDASQTKKNLFAGTGARKEIEKFAARARLYHNQHTLPWADKGERLLPTKLVMEYLSTIKNYEVTFNSMCINFFADYDRLVAEAPLHLGSLYKASDYPSIDEVKLKFGFRRSVNPLPESGDFRLDIPSIELEELKADYEAKFEERLADAMKAPWDKLHKVLTDMSEKLKDNGDEKKRFHDTFISNPIELCELLTKLNITNDPKLEQARKDLESTMMGVHIEAIKEDGYEREQLKSKVDSILNKFNW
jgi:hypothetical protein